MTDGLAKLVAGLAPPFAFAGLAIRPRGGPPRFALATAPGITATETTLFRAASISKIVTGQTLLAVARRAGIRNLQAGVDEILGFRLRNPAFPDVPITLAQVLAHSAGLSDAAGYLVPADQTLEDWIAAAGVSCFQPHPPGTYYSYSNLGYLIAAAAAERLGQDRFDLLADREVLRPLGIAAGFNWSGLPAHLREQRIATFRRRPDSRFLAQIDDRVPPTGIGGPDGAIAPDVPWRPGCAVARLSPQGGLRISLAGCLTLACALSDIAVDRLWTPAMGPGDYLPGPAESTGAGVQIFDNPAFYPRPLIGHFANAYGFAGGVWYDRTTGTAFAYALNGLPEGDDDDALRPEELALFDAAARVAA